MINSISPQLQNRIELETPQRQLWVDNRFASEFGDATTVESSASNPTGGATANVNLLQGLVYKPVVPSKTQPVPSTGSPAPTASPAPAASPSPCAAPDARPPAKVPTAAESGTTPAAEPPTPQNNPWQGNWAAPDQSWETQPWNTQTPLMLRDTATGQVTQWTGQMGQALPAPTCFIGLEDNPLGTDVPVSGPDGWMQQYQMLQQTPNSWLAIANPCLATSILGPQLVGEYQQQGLLPLNLPPQVNFTGFSGPQATTTAPPGWNKLPTAGSSA